MTKGAFAKAGPQLSVAIVILGLATAGAYAGHLTAVEAAGLIGLLLGGVGVVTVAVLNSPLPNSDLIPHLIFTLAVIAAIGVLLFHGSFTSTVAITLLTPILGGAGAIAASNSTTNAIAALAPQTPFGGNVQTGEPVTLTGTLQPSPVAPTVQATIPPTFGQPGITDPGTTGVAS